MVISIILPLGWFQLRGSWSKCLPVSNKSMSHNLVILTAREDSSSSQVPQSVGDFLNAWSWFVYFRNQLLDSRTRNSGVHKLSTNYWDSHPMVRNQSWGGLFLINWFCFLWTVSPGPHGLVVSRNVQISSASVSVHLPTASLLPQVPGGRAAAGEVESEPVLVVVMSDVSSERVAGMVQTRTDHLGILWRLTHQPQCLYIFSCVKPLNTIVTNYYGDKICN